LACNTISESSRSGEYHTRRAGRGHGNAPFGTSTNTRSPRQTVLYSCSLQRRARAVAVDRSFESNRVTVRGHGRGGGFTVVGGGFTVVGGGFTVVVVDGGVVVVVVVDGGGGVVVVVVVVVVVDGGGVVVVDGGGVVVVVVDGGVVVVVDVVDDGGTVVVVVVVVGGGSGSPAHS
jgi:hypothetical protein